jgi:hypothetical protein
MFDRRWMAAFALTVIATLGGCKHCGSDSNCSPCAQPIGRPGCPTCGPGAPTTIVPGPPPGQVSPTPPPPAPVGPYGASFGRQL